VSAQPPKRGPSLRRFLRLGPVIEAVLRAILAEAIPLSFLPELV
jgi:hypothetical protein